jgi:hypothetical protein
MKIRILLLLSLAVAAIPSRAITISQWTFDGSIQTPASVDPNVTASNFTLSSGSVSFVQGNPSSGIAISGTGWNVADGNKWWEFTVTANAGYTLNFTSLTFDDRVSSTGPTGWSVTINGITADSNQATHSAFSASPMNAVDLSAGAFQALTSADVRIFGFGASGSSGTFRLDNVTLDGTVVQIQSVPETLPFAFTALVLVSLIALSRRFVKSTV